MRFLGGDSSKPNYVGPIGFAKILTQEPGVHGWQSGQMHQTVNLAGYALRRFESFPVHAGLRDLTETSHVKQCYCGIS